jgi:hypothetical protein
VKEAYGRGEDTWRSDGERQILDMPPNLLDSAERMRRPHLIDRCSHSGTRILVLNEFFASHYNYSID